MLPQWIIEKKRDGAELDTADIRAFIAGYTDGTIPDYQMAALAMAIYFNGMNARETADLTVAMMESGKVIDPNQISGIKVDKHSTGGIGDKISIPLAPLVAACGATVPMISGRGLGITGGTLDKLESIPGYRVGLSEQEFFQTLEKVGCSMIGQTAEIAPADKKLYALRDVTATVPSIPLIVSSIMSKKMAEGIDSLVLDVKCGSGAFMKDIESARALAKGLVDTGVAMGKKVVALITDMNQPLGRAVGNALEIQESLDILSGNGPADAQGLTITLAEHMLRVAEVLDLGGGVSNPALHLQDGTALQKFRQMVACHGGDLDAGLPVASNQIPLPSPKSGYVSKADADAIGRASLLLGAGRAKTTDAIDHAVGISDLKKIGERVEEGEPLCTIHSNGHEDEAQLQQLLESAFEISDNTIEPPPLILEIVSS
ncbi:thymidine phosphorylase [Pontiella sulfatireligans]|uniref:thymidine phosphorylase n=1 Tax=Pontiella sulfatireligans TaxID=2750658 RepID=A0A6C2UKH6_9BACT|nr:thymidine phosphorylase [Pontiella sulfatireligans]VGO19814.1 Pyrimidine-nucleoside phosphorylase [Pontiella sulfatireligans]